MILRLIILVILSFSLCGASQQREVPGDRVQLDFFSYDRTSSVLRWRASFGSLDAKGEYRSDGEPLVCSLYFNRFEATCGNETFEMSPAVYGDSATEFNAMMDHMFKITAIVEQDRREHRK